MIEITNDDLSLEQEPSQRNLVKQRFVQKIIHEARLAFDETPALSAAKQTVYDLTAQENRPLQKEQRQFAAANPGVYGGEIDEAVLTNVTWYIFEKSGLRASIENAVEKLIASIEQDPEGRIVGGVSFPQLQRERAEKGRGQNSLKIGVNFVAAKRKTPGKPAQGVTVPANGVYEVIIFLGPGGTLECNLKQINTFAVIQTDRGEIEEERQRFEGLAAQEEPETDLPETYS